MARNMDSVRSKPNEEKSNVEVVVVKDSCTPLLDYDHIKITSNDLNCLNSGQYLNDTIINFYLKYLHKTLLDDDQRRSVYICDSFFMEAIRTADPQRIARWEQRLNIFEKDYIIIPVEGDQHWILLVLCHPNNIVNNDNVAGNKSKILVMDSMGDYARPEDLTALKEFVMNSGIGRNIIPSHYLDDFDKRLQCINCPVKEQRNDYDCGLFLMENAETFLIDTFNLPANVHDPPALFRLTKSRSKRYDLKSLIEHLVVEEVIYSSAKSALNSRPILIN